MASTSTPTPPTSNLIRSIRHTRAVARELAASSVECCRRAQEAVARVHATWERIKQRQSARDWYIAEKKRERADASQQIAGAVTAGRRSQNLHLGQALPSSQVNLLRRHAMLATPRVIRCDRCRSARSQAVMARVRHVADRDTEWICPECRTVWAFVSAPATEFLVRSRDVSALRPSVCPCPLGGPLQVAREVGVWGSARPRLWVCAGCGAGHAVGDVASA